MLYYRYRPISELSLKELRYGEIYFSSAEENNDPYDGKVFLLYNFDEDKWKRLFERAWLNVKLPNELLSQIAMNLSKVVVKNNPKTYEDVQTFNFQEALLLSSPQIGALVSYNLSLCIKKFIDIYKPEHKYSVSFSRVNNNILMWSHYASQHKGYCLIFKDLDGYLYQDEFNKVTSMKSLVIGDKFSFQDVIYVPECQLIDASRFMPRISDIKFGSEEERIAFCNENEAKCLEKHMCWAYEKESRLLLHTAPAWIMGKHIEYTKEERLFYYKQNQLVGIILGALMDESDKVRIKEILRINNHKMLITHKTGAIFDFALFEASLLSNKREVSIQPTEIYKFGEVITKDNEKFNSYYQDWNNGLAIVLNSDGSAHKQQFP